MTVTAVERIRTACERQAQAMRLRPSIARGTASTRVRVEHGFRCAIEEGPWKLVADMAEKHGGAGAGPNPGVLGRAALGSCLAMSYTMWAARLGVPIAALEIEIQADYDARGSYGVDSVAPGYNEVRYVVTIESPAPESEILALLDQADEHTPYLDIFRHPQAVRRQVRVRRPAEAGAVS